jgi:hypothetical protein
MVWKSPSTCQPIAAYLDRIVCGTCTSYAVTIGVLDAATGAMVWALRIDGMKDDVGCRVSEDGKVLVSHRVENASSGFEPRELIVLNSKDGSFFGAYSYRGYLSRVRREGVLFMQQDYEKPRQFFAFDWGGKGRQIAERSADQLAWIDVREGDPWIFRKSAKDERAAVGDHFRWDGTFVKTVDPVMLNGECSGSATSVEVDGKIHCMSQRGDRITFQPAQGGPITEHIGGPGVLHGSGDLIRSHQGYIARHRPASVSQGAVVKK